jgi:hypothetical protein
VRLVFESCGSSHAETRPVVPGAPSNSKGLGMVGVVLSLPLSELRNTDRHDLFDLGTGAPRVVL